MSDFFRFRIHLLAIPLLMTIFFIILLTFITQQPDIAIANNSQFTTKELVTFLNQDQRLHWTTAGAFHAPDNNWNGGIGVTNGPYTATQAYALHAPHACIFQTSVTDENNEEIGGQDVGDFKQIFAQIWGVHRTVLHEADLTLNNLNNCDLLILPSFTLGYAAQVSDTLGTAALNTIADYTRNGGRLYAQGEGMYLVEAAGLIPPHTITDEDLRPTRLDGLGTIIFNDSPHQLTLGWQSQDLLILDDPIINVTGTLQTIASYSDTVAGPHPAVVTTSAGHGEITLVSGRANSRADEDQWILLRNILLLSAAEKAEYFGRAIQTYTNTVEADIIPAYEPGIPISVTLNYNHLWQGETHSSVIITEVVSSGFIVDIHTITPAPTNVSTQTGETLIVWNMGDMTKGNYTFTYVATTEADAVRGTTDFSTGYITYEENSCPITLDRDPFALRALLPAELVGGHDNEADRHFTIPEEGLFIEEWIWVENIEDSQALNTKLVRYIPLIAPIVGLEEQREPLTTNAAETVWMRNDVFTFLDDHLHNRDLPTGFNSYTGTWGLEQWDGTTFITMTTPGGYHLDPILDNRSPTPGFFVTIPPTYTHAITVTENGELLLPALRLEWDIGRYPAFNFDLPLARYGIHSYELFSRPVSFIGDPFVDTVVVDATGGSIYTGAGDNPLMYRDYLDVDIEIHPPQAPADQGFTYEDIWGRVHTETLRANFVDVFNFASCACGPGGNFIGERSAALNVTFEIFVDTDGDGVEETSLVDFVAERGYMPTHLDGHIIYYIKSRNLGSTIARGENIIDEGIFRGLNYTIVPSNTTWAHSYESTHSTLLTATVDGAYDHLIFEQAIPPAQTDLIAIHGKIEMNGSIVEGLMQLHQGARFAYRQNFAGEGQYEVQDTHVQAIIGKRSDARLNTFVMPSLISTYADTVFLDLALNDQYDFHPFNRDPYLASWGHGLSAATVYIGGREQRTVYHSLIDLGDTTLLRVELNNNEAQTWSNIGVNPIAPAGITITPYYTDDVPASLWPDLPFLHLDTISEAGYAIYYFRIETDKNATDLQGHIHEIEIEVTGSGLPTTFAVPPAMLAIRAADGSAPLMTYGTSDNIRLTDVLPDYVTPIAVKILTDDQFNTLQSLVVDDTAIIPATNLSDDYFNSLTQTIPFSLDGQSILIEVPNEILPWTVSNNLHVVIYNDITVNRAASYPIHNQTTLSTTDSFDMEHAVTDIGDEVDAIGAELTTSYDISHIIHGNTGFSANYLAVNQWNTVTLSMTTKNTGTDIAQNLVNDIELTSPFSITNGSQTITATGQTLVWNVAPNLAAGASRTATVTLEVFATTPSLTVRTADSTIIDSMRAINQTDSNFYNVTARSEINAQTGNSFSLPVGYRGANAPTIHQFATDTLTLIEGDETAVQTISILRGGNIAEETTITVTMQGLTAINGVDFTAQTHIVNFAANQATADITLEIIGNLNIEPNRTILLSLSEFDDLIVAGEHEELILTIQDDDDVSAIAAYHTFVDNLQIIKEGDIGLTTQSVTIHRTGFLDQTSTVNVKITAGTAIPEVDFIPETVSITFSRGESTAQIPIQLLGDIDYNEDHTLLLTISDFNKVWLPGTQLTQTVQVRNDDFYTFLPVGLSGYASPLPDLVIQSLVVTTNTVTLVIVNEGDAPVTEEFWADLYIDPHNPPTAVDERWDSNDDGSNQGVAWGVTESLGIGESLTLTLDSPYFVESRSRFSNDVRVGTVIYAQVDTISPIDSNHGAVLEIHERNNAEYNNIFKSISIE